jgi:hemerythrin-like metal-binding protein
MTSGVDCPGETLAKMTSVVDRLAQYAQEHFVFEEGCMQRCSCSAAGVNKMAHQRFVRMVEATIKALKSEPPTRDAFESLHRGATCWVNKHIHKLTEIEAA